jgi:hypothetical protein
MRMRTNDFRLVLCGFLVSGLLFVLPVLTAAQDTGILSGTLADSSDHRVPGAAVTLLVHRTVENPRPGIGRWEHGFRAVQPGTYAVSVELSGFR